MRFSDEERRVIRDLGKLLAGREEPEDTPEPERQYRYRSPLERVLDHADVLFLSCELPRILPWFRRRRAAIYWRYLRRLAREVAFLTRARINLGQAPLRSIVAWRIALEWHLFALYVAGFLYLIGGSGRAQSCVRTRLPRLLDLLRPPPAPAEPLHELE